MTNPIFNFTATNPFGLTDVGDYSKPTFVDIDGDGDLDALVGNSTGNTLFFDNTGTASTPSFAAASTNSFGLTDVGSWASPTFVDIDDDGDLDALIGNLSGNTRFFENTGTASNPAFAAAITNPFGLASAGSFSDPTFVDIDDDGDLDALIGNVSGNTLFFENTGTASSPVFATASTNSFGLTDVGSWASPTFVDIDGDGDLDALIGNLSGNTRFFENTGTASSPVFATASTNPFGLVSAGSFSNPTFVDIDGDGDLDALVGNSTGNTLFFENTLSPVNIIQSGGTTAVTEGGTTDSYSIVLRTQPTANVSITLDNTNQQITTDVTTLTFTSANWNIAQTVVVTAVDDSVGESVHTGVIKHSTTSADARYNNSLVDTVIASITDNDLPVGEPVFTFITTNPFGLSNVGSYAKPILVDIDGDGDLDAFIGAKNGNTLFFQNTGSASSPSFAPAFVSPFGLTDIGLYADPTFVDIDGDGDLDALIGERLGNTLFFENTGTANSPVFATASTNPFGLTDVGSWASPTFVDIDGDDDLDALIGNVSGNTLFFENTGTASSPVFATASTNPFGLTDVGYFTSPTFVDIDGDGDLDALIGEYNGNTHFFENTGTASNPVFATASANSFGLFDVGSLASPTFVDIDSDGDLDALIGDNTGNTRFFENTLSPVIIAQSDGATSVTEGGATDSFSIVLRNQPTANVTITLDNTNQQITTDVTTLTFTPANWNIAQTVVVTAVNDSVGENIHTGVIKHSTTSSDARYNNLVDTVIVSITDNDLPIGEPVFTFTATNPFGLTDVGSWASPTLVDIDGDGDLDALIGNAYGNMLFFENTGTASNPVFATASTNPFGLTDVGYSAKPTFVDLDGDGDLDAFIGESFGNTLFFENTGTASSPSFAAISTNPFGLTDVGYNAEPTFVDIDGDGDLDALIGNNSGNTSFFENTGTASNPSFSAISTNPFGLADVGLSANPTLVDIDGDGDLDALIGNLSGNTLFFENTGTASNPSFAAASTNPFGLFDVGNFSSPTFVDIDGDGDLDALIGDSTGNTRFFTNNLTTPPEAPTATNLNAAETYTEDTPLNLMDIVITDGDSANVTATLTLSNTAAGSLSTATSGSVTSTYNAGTGEWAASGTLADVNTLLAGVIFNPALNFNANFTVSTSITDGDTTAITGTKSFTGVAVNDAPTVANAIANQNGTQDAEFNFVVPANTFDDVDVGDVLSYAATLADDSPLPSWLGFDAGTQTFNGTPLTADVGTINVKVIATDSSIASVSDLFDITVATGTGGALLFSTPGDDILTGTASLNDTVSYINATAAVTVSLEKTTQQNTNGAGRDTITKIENLIGSDFNDNLKGKSGPNQLNGGVGNDRIDGRGGADVMIGGLGNDIYNVNNAGDIVTENPGEGTDKINSRVTYTLPDNVEDLILKGGASINGIGNDLKNKLIGNSAVNQLEGGVGDDRLDGKAGADTMIGGLGKDIYVVDNVGDIVIENASEGRDTIKSIVTYTLPNNVEKLTLTGGSAIDGMGNSANNTLTGNSAPNLLTGDAGNDKLDGKGGNNILTGGAGKDIFKFTTGGHIDTITDFDVPRDTIQLDNAVFTALTSTGTLAADQFIIGTVALDANDFIIYDDTAGSLSYDADGSGAGAAVQIAVVGVGLSMTNADIVVI